MFPIKTTTVMTQEVYERYSWALLLRRKRLYISIGLIELALLMFALAQLWDGSSWLFFVFLGLTIILPLALLLGFKDQIKRAYAKNPTLQDIEQELFFYEDHVLVKTKRGEVTYQYREITEIIVAKEDFYIMLGKDMGLPIKKADCPPDLQTFITELKAVPPQTGA